MLSSIPTTVTILNLIIFYLPYKVSFIWFLLRGTLSFPCLTKSKVKIPWFKHKVHSRMLTTDEWTDPLFPIFLSNINSSNKHNHRFYRSSWDFRNSCRVFIQRKIPFVLSQPVSQCSVLWDIVDRLYQVSKRTLLITYLMFSVFEVKSVGPNQDLKEISKCPNFKQKRQQQQQISYVLWTSTRCENIRVKIFFKIQPIAFVELQRYESFIKF